MTIIQLSKVAQAYYEGLYKPQLGYCFNSP